MQTPPNNLIGGFRPPTSGGGFVTDMRDRTLQDPYEIGGGGQLGLARNDGSYTGAMFLPDENRPRLYVSDRCENTITAMLEYMGVSREEAYKDPVDCVRYLCVSDPIYIGSNYSVGTECAGGY